MRRRQFLKAGAVLLPLLGGWPLRGADAANALKFDYSGNVFLAPDDPGAWAEFRAALTAWRARTRTELHYTDELYHRSEFAWSASNYSCCFLMVCDERFLNRRDGSYAVDAILDEGTREFGGYDSVVLWHAYPRIGIDDRNQFDFYRDLPGGLSGVRRAVRRFHRRGVRVYLDYNPWDVGTRREDVSDLDALVEIVRKVEADGVFLDTMRRGAKEFRAKLDRARPGVILESEGAVPLENLHDHHASWAQWFGDSYAPGVLKHKWLERRHMQHQVRRWDSDHTDELHAAWMNGSGMMVWENVFGSWMPWNQRDRALLRSMLPIQRRFSKLFSGEGWTPLVGAEQPGVFASLWEGDGLRLWTLVNRSENRVEGTLLKVSALPAATGSLGERTLPGETTRHRYFDLVRGEEAAARPDEQTVILSGAIPPRGIGCFLCGKYRDLGKGFGKFLQRQAGLNSRAVFEPARPQLRTRLIEFPAVKPLSSVPEGMVEVPPATLVLNIKMRVRECGFYESTPPAGHTLADSYNFQLQTFQRRAAFRRFAIDETPVTNTQFARFLAASKYKPQHSENFLKHWSGGMPPKGKEEHPVVYLDLDDARAYAKWAGKRLPTEEEWQYAAQGTDQREYPWGDRMEPGRCNDGSTGGTTQVKAFPNGRSPFGCHDMCGNVWHWTESVRTDGRTRFCIVRGGGWFTAKGSNWYMDGGPRPANFAAKFLLTWAGLDRCASVGFRCVAEI